MRVGGVGMSNRSLPSKLGAGQQDLHRRQDLRSLALHEEAVRVLRLAPGRAWRALSVLDRWDESKDDHSSMLRAEWRRIIEGQLWDLAVEDSERGNQLCQASPLGFVLEPRTRHDILRRFSRDAVRDSSPN